MASFSKNYKTFYPKNVHQALKNMGLGSGIRDAEKTHSGSRIQGSKKAPDPGSATLLETIFFKYFNSFMLIRDPGWKQFGSGIQDGNNSDPGWKKV